MSYLSPYPRSRWPPETVLAYAREKHDDWAPEGCRSGRPGAAARSTRQRPRRPTSDAPGPTVSLCPTQHRTQRLGRWSRIMFRLPAGLQACVFDLGRWPAWAAVRPCNGDADVRRPSPRRADEDLEGLARACQDVVTARTAKTKVAAATVGRHKGFRRTSGDGRCRVPVQPPSKRAGGPVSVVGVERTCLAGPAGAGTTESDRLEAS
jgi:hypothetical protein